MSKQIPWDKLTIGDTFGPIELPYVERYFTCEMEKLNPIHAEKSPWGGPVYPAMYMGTLLGLRLIGSRYDSHATLPTRLYQKNINPAGLDKKLFLAGRLIDKYIRRGLEYVAMPAPKAIRPPCFRDTSCAVICPDILKIFLALPG